MTEAAIAAEGVVKRFGPVIALDRVSFELPPGGVPGLAAAIPAAITRYRHAASA